MTPFEIKKKIKASTLMDLSESTFLNLESYLKKGRTCLKELLRSLYSCKIKGKN